MESKTNLYLLKIPAHLAAFGFMWQFLSGKKFQLHEALLKDGYLQCKILLWHHFEPNALVDFIFLGLNKAELDRYGKPSIEPFVKVKRPVGRPKKTLPVTNETLLIAFPNGATLSKVN